MDKLIGVLGYDNTRSQTDKRYLSEFSCQGRKYADNKMLPNDGSGVLGYVQEERSLRDMQLLKNYSCSRENYTDTSRMEMMTEPRSPRDIAMLKEYNPGTCKEGYLQRGGHMGQSGKVQYLRNGGPFENYECPYARLNYNPYNSSANVKYVPLM